MVENEKNLKIVVEYGELRLAIFKMIRYNNTACIRGEVEYAKSCNQRERGFR